MQRLTPHRQKATENYRKWAPWSPLAHMTHIEQWTKKREIAMFQTHPLEFLRGKTEEELEESLNKT